METKAKVLVGDEFLSGINWFGKGWDVAGTYKEHFDLITEDDLRENDALYGEVQAIVALTVLTRVELSKFTALKILCKPCAGLDRMYPYFAQLKEMGTRVVHNPDVVNVITADMAMALILSTARNITMSHNGITVRNEFQRVLGRPVSGATIGIIGLGNIGSAIAKRTKAFDMDILYNTRSRRPEMETLVGATHYPNLHEMLPLCDFVVIACPLTKDTQNLMTAKEFSLMKNTSILVNIARGKIVDTDDLVKALQSGSIWGAGLDVTDPEPLPEKHPLKELDRVVLTPHSGGAVPGVMERAHRGLIKGILAYLKDGSTVPEVTVVDLDKYTDM